MRKYKKIAIYLRISMEDKAGDGKILKEQWESKSISSQRKLLLEFISRDAKLAEQEIAEFSDDGFSGTNMDRPGMQELLKQVKQGKINCILVKDMSRFSRDYIELGDYLNQIFPLMGIRFIAVNDHYDSREHEGNTMEMDTAFQTLLYDLYCKDVSVKVKAAIRSKCANGEFAFGQVPFGYSKSETEKNTVIVNEKEATVVRYIFFLAEKGMSSTQIARTLIEEQTPAIAQMRYPDRKVIPDHHEPLVTPEVFELVSSFRPEQSTKRKHPKHPLTGKIYCGGCGYAINYKPQRNSRKTLRGFKRINCAK